MENNSVQSYQPRRFAQKRDSMTHELWSDALRAALFIQAQVRLPSNVNSATAAAC
jgi:hypothetical protein